MPRYKLRTLLIVLALGPMVLAGAWFSLPTVVYIALHLIFGPPIHGEWPF
jgi:hypothetical protein